VTLYGGAENDGHENAGHEIAGHAKAKQKTSSEALSLNRLSLLCLLLLRFEDCGRSKQGLSHRLEHTRNSLINVTPAL